MALSQKLKYMLKAAGHNTGKNHFGAIPCAFIFVDNRIISLMILSFKLMHGRL